MGLSSPLQGGGRRRGRARCPLEPLWRVRRGAGAAQALVSALEPLLEPSGLSTGRARMSKTEIEHTPTMPSNYYEQTTTT